MATDILNDATDTSPANVASDMLTNATKVGKARASKPKASAPKAPAREAGGVIQIEALPGAATTAPQEVIEIALPAGTHPDKNNYDVVTPPLKLRAGTPNKSNQLYFRMIAYKAIFKPSAPGAIPQWHVTGTRADFSRRGLVI